MRQLILYTGNHCSLCDQAKMLIYPLLTEYGWTLEEINIANNAALKNKYGSRIPVVVTPGGEEKDWPFTSGQIKRELKADNL